MWGYATCDAAGTVCGANDGTASWPQAALVISPDAIVRQPPWHAHNMIANAWGMALLGTAPNVTRVGNGQIDILALLAPADGDRRGPRLPARRLRRGAPSGVGLLQLHLTSTSDRPVWLTLDLAGGGACAVPEGGWPAQLLASANASDFNTLAVPDKVRPTATRVAQASASRLEVEVPPHSLVVASVPLC